VGAWQSEGWRKKRARLDELATAFVELNVPPDEYSTLDQGYLDALNRAWLNRETRTARRFAAICLILARANGGTAEMEDMMALVGAPKQDEDDGE
jgi:hypothetical protein